MEPKKASKTRMSEELEHWTRRGCLYDFEHYGKSEDAIGSYGIVVYAFGSDGKLLWDGCTSWEDGDTVAQVLRWARESAEVARAERREVCRL